MSAATPQLFTPLRLRDLTLANRVVVSPMCQYSGRDGCAVDWHVVHVGQLRLGGAGLTMMEMTNVTPEGRITPRCLGLYDDACEASLAKVLDMTRGQGRSPVGLQLAHAGRKASTRAPWEGRDALSPADGGWQPRAPSAIPSGPDSPLPAAFEAGEVDALVEAFASAARRAARVGFDALQVHMAHGYLLHQFLSPLANQRDDDFGGDAERRMRVPLRVFEAVRSEFPAAQPVGARVSASDWSPGGFELADCIELVKRLEALGCDWVDVSSGGLTVKQQIPVSPGYQVPFAEAVRAATSVPTLAVGLITEPEQAEAIIADGQADLVGLARGMLYDPRWAWHAADALAVPDAVEYPYQYRRARPARRSDAFGEHDRVAKR